jgi:thiopeptide-type bacteriocin biosynthesis protein
MLGISASAALAATASAEVAHDPDAMHAELVYLPHRGRLCNVAVRPSIYEHEVNFATSPSVDPYHAIPIAELLVGVRTGQLYTRWREAPGDLCIHAGHMLNSGEAPAVCRFLEDVSRGRRRLLAPFSWDDFAEMPFLPRVEVGKAVISVAQWRITVEVRDTVLRPGDSGFASRLDEWRADWLVPEMTYLSVGDNRLLLDLRSPDDVEQLRGELRRLRSSHFVLLQEPLPAPEHAWMEGHDGGYLPELVVRMVRSSHDAAPVSHVTARRTREPTPRERFLPLGSEWLYLRVHAPSARHDELLAGPVRRIVEVAVHSGLAQQWHFVRYADPEPHLRLRFGGEPDQLVSHLLPELCAWGQQLITEGLCSRLAFDTYDREIERYGGPGGIGHAEAIFTADSDAVVEMLRTLSDATTSLDRTEMAVLSVDDLLSTCGLDVSRRLDLYRGGVADRRATSSEYRQRAHKLRLLLGGSAAEGDRPLGSTPGALREILRRRRLALAPVISRLRSLEDSGTLTKSVDAMCATLMHMHCNRLLGPGPPTEPGVIGLLTRTLESLHVAPLADISVTRDRPD